MVNCTFKYSFQVICINGRSALFECFERILMACSSSCLFWRHNVFNLFVRLFTCNAVLSLYQAEVLTVIKDTTVHTASDSRPVCPVTQCNRAEPAAEPVKRHAEDSPGATSQSCGLALAPVEDGVKCGVFKQRREKHAWRSQDKVFFFPPIS